MNTNRDLYLFIVELASRSESSALSLQTYLTNLRLLGRQRAGQAHLAFEDVAEMLESAFEPVVSSETATPCADFTSWEERISYLIRDLAEMAENGSLNDPHRYFGIDAPRGARWYNFEPGSFLEAGVYGTFGGWEDGDDGGRRLVSGNVAVLNEDGEVETVDPSSIESSVVEIQHVDWAVFTEFLIDGATYE